jgi:hypothetical protein
MQRKRCTCAQIVLPSALGLIITVTADAERFYVDASAPPGGDGSEWGLAFDDLQDALNVPPQNGDEIWVAAGTYVPSVPTGRTATFDLDTLNLQIFGGFAGTENTLAERDIVANPTILSGGTAPSYHVVTVNDISELNGFTVSDGRADALFHTYGGGIRAGPGALGDEHHIAVVNCIVENNSAGVYPNPEPSNPHNGGGGVAAVSFRARATLVNSVFRNNTAVGESPRGGAVYGQSGLGGGTVELRNCLFYDNSVSANAASRAVGRGGAIHASVDPITNCTIADNAVTSTGGQGGGIYVPSTGFATLTNCIVWGNADNSGQGTSAAQIFRATAGTPVCVSYSTIEGGYTCPASTPECGEFAIACGTGNQSSDPLFLGSGDYRLDIDSPSVDSGHDPTVEDAVLLPFVDVYDVDDDGDETEPTPDLDFTDRVIGAAVDRGPYEYPCDLRADFNEDGLVGFADLLQLLSEWGPCESCPPSCEWDVNGDCEVGFADLLFVLSEWCLSATLAEAIEEGSCLDIDDWNEFMAVMTDPQASQATKDNYYCWMNHYLNACTPSCERAPCNGVDPFDNACGGH